MIPERQEANKASLMIAIFKSLGEFPGHGAKRRNPGRAQLWAEEIKLGVWEDEGIWSLWDRLYRREENYAE